MPCTHRKRPLFLALAALIGSLAGAQPPDPYTWSTVGPMGTARADACAVLLQDGRALIVGGIVRRRRRLAFLFTHPRRIRHARFRRECHAAQRPGAHLF